MTYIQRGTRTFKMANLALFAGGFSTFAILWGPQALLPDIASEFHVSPTISSLSISAATITLAISLLIAGSLSEVFGRKPIMTISLVASAILTIITAFSPSFELLLLCRVFQGFTLAGLPAVAMAYIGEEMESRSLGMVMGLYISGNSLGGMTGRIIAGVLTDYISWQAAYIVIGIISLFASFLFLWALPKSTHFEKQKFALKRLSISLFSQFKERGLICLFSLAFLLMGGLVSLYNYIGFELMKPPYSLSQTLVGFIFIVYIVGTFSSTWMGMLADQHGKRRILQLSLVILLIGSTITLSSNLWLMILGLAIFTYGFFGAHSIASSWVGKMATHDRAQASALYLFFYYMGSSVGGTVSGAFYDHFGWPGVVAMILIIAMIAIAISIQLGRIEKKQGINEKDLQRSS